jgi:hypothetical protein
VGVEKFDGLPNPDGGRPIDVAAELHQLARTTPENLKYLSLSSTTSRQDIEAKAVQIEKARQKWWPLEMSRIHS